MMSEQTKPQPTKDQGEADNLQLAKNSQSPEQKNIYRADYKLVENQLQEKKKLQKFPEKNKDIIITKDLIDRLATLYANTTLSLTTILWSNPEFPYPETLMRWRNKSDEMAKYINESLAHAREDKADTFFELMPEIAGNVKRVKTRTKLADGKTVVTSSDNYNRSRLMIDTLKFITSKLNPKKYGDKIDVTVNQVKQVTGMRIISGIEDVNEIKDEPKHLTD